MTENVLNFFEQPGADGDNKFIVGGTMETATGTHLRVRTASVLLPDVSSASSLVYAFPGVTGEIQAIRAVQNAGVTGANGVISFTIGGGSPIGSTISILAGSSAGDVYTINPSTATITGSQEIEVTTDGGSTGVCPVTINIEILLD